MSNTAVPVPCSRKSSTTLRVKNKDVAYITENINRDIIVTDLKKHAFIADDRLEIFQYSNSEKDSDFDVSSEAHNSFGHVVVTDYGKDKIYMLDSDG